MLQRILVPLDGSERAERAVWMAARLARGAGSTLFLLRIVNVPPIKFVPYGEPAQIALALIENARKEGEDYLQKLARRADLNGLAIETRVIEGHIAADIVDCAREEKCDLIVICTHGYSGLNRWRLGRVAAQIARHAPVPVLVIPAHDDPASDATSDSDTENVRILVTLDGSELAEAAIQPALDLAQALASSKHVTLHLLEVVDFVSVALTSEQDNEGTAFSTIGPEEYALDHARAYLATVAERITQANTGMTVTSAATLESDVANAILEEAGRLPRYGMIVMATHGRGGLQRWALGSTTERVLHATHLPLLIARSKTAVQHDNDVAEALAEAELHR